VTTHRYRRGGTEMTFGMIQTGAGPPAVTSFVASDFSGNLYSAGACPCIFPYYAVAPIAGAPEFLVTGNSQFGFARSFRLSDIVNYNELGNLYDRYRIVETITTLTLLSNMSEVNGNSYLPTLTYALDYDDVGLPTYGSLAQRYNARNVVLNYAKPLVIKCRPKVYVESAASGNSTNYAGGNLISRKAWLDIQDADIDHFGIKFYFRNWESYTNVNPILACRMEVEYIIEMNQSR